jgi:hypothetical protein
MAKKNQSAKAKVVAAVQSAVDRTLNGSGNAAGGGRSAQKRARRRNQGGGASSAPVSVGMGNLSVNQPVISGGSGSVVVTNTEFVTDVSWSGGSSSGILSMNVNPSASEYPWLSKIANCYDLYRIRSWKFTYTPTCSSATSGVVVLAFDYDASDAAPTSKQMISAYGGSKRGNVWNKLEINMGSCPWRYVGVPGGGNPAGTDIKMYVPAKFYLALYNLSSAMTVGDLTVSYQVEFGRPNLESPISALSELVLPSNSTLTNPAGDSQTQYGSIPLTVSSTTSGSMTGIKIKFSKALPLLLNLRAAIRNATSAIPTFPLVEYYPYEGFIGPATPVSTNAYTGHWPDANTDIALTAESIVSVAAAGYIVFWLHASWTKFVLYHLRLATYPPTN